MPAVPAEIDASPAEALHWHEHDRGHGGDPGPLSRHHAHAPGRHHPAARPRLSLLRISVWQRLVLVLPLAALIWAATLAVIWYGAA